MQLLIAKRLRVLAGAGALSAFAAFAAPSVAAPDRLAVLTTADDDALADNLAEVAISHLAKRRGWELVGARELRRRLPEALSSESLRACLARPVCLTTIGRVANAGRAVIGDVRRDGDGWRIELSITDLRTGVVGPHFEETVSASDVGLIAAIRQGLDELFSRSAAPAAPPSTAPAAPLPAVPPAAPSPSLALRGDGEGALGRAARPAALDLSLEARASPERRGSLLPYLGVGAAAAAVVSFSAAVVTGSFATAPLMGITRGERQADLQRHDEYAAAANVLLGAGTAFALVAVGSFYRLWRGERGGAARTAHDAASVPSAP
jgi:hypothetical protein